MINKPLSSVIVLLLLLFLPPLIPFLNGFMILFIFLNIVNICSWIKYNYYFKSILLIALVVYLCVWLRCYYLSMDGFFSLPWGLYIGLVNINLFVILLVALLSPKLVNPYVTKQNKLGKSSKTFQDKVVVNGTIKEEACINSQEKRVKRDDTQKDHMPDIQSVSSDDIQTNVGILSKDMKSPTIDKDGIMSKYSF